MTQNDQESTITTFFGQNWTKPVFSVEIDQNPLISVKTQFFQSKSTKPGLFGQNQPKPVQIPVFPAKIDEDQFFRPKSTKTTFFGQNRPKSVFLAKIDEDQFFGHNQPKPMAVRKIPGAKQKNENSQMETKKR